MPQETHTTIANAVNILKSRVRTLRKTNIYKPPGGVLGAIYVLKQTLQLTDEGVFTGVFKPSNLNGGKIYSDSIEKIGEAIRKAKGALDKIDDSKVKEMFRKHINNVINATQNIIQLRLMDMEKHLQNSMKNEFPSRLGISCVQREYVVYDRLDRFKTCKAGGAAAQKFGGETKARERYNRAMASLKREERYKTHQQAIKALIKAQTVMGEVLPDG